MGQELTEFVKEHPLISAFVLLLVGIFMIYDATSDATEDALMLAAEDVGAIVTEVSAADNGNTRVSYAWDRFGTKHTETISTKVPALQSLKAGSRVVIGVHPDNEDQGLPKAYLEARQGEYITLGPLQGTDLIYVGLFMMAFAVLLPVWVRLG